MKARKIAQDELTDSIVRHEAQLEIDRLALLKYENECSKGSISTKQFETIMDGASTSAKEYALETKGAAGSTDVFVAKQEQAQESLKATATASKGASIAMKALATVGNMFIGWAISEVLTLASKAISDYINRLEISKEKLAETESELDSVDSELKNITLKIKELESLEMPSLTDKEDLERLRAENKELAIRKKYLEDQKKLESEEVVQNAKEKMDYNYGRTTSRESIDAYKAYMDNPTLYTSETDTTTIKIAQYEHYQELRKQALENEDLETIEILDTKLKDIEESLLADRTELQNFKDDLSLTGEASPELDNVINKLEFIDNLLLAPSENLKNFLNSDEIVKDTAKLTELAYSGELTESQFKESFSKINTYLKENGLTFQDLISVLGIYRDELEGLPEGNKSADLLGISETITELDTKLKPAMDALGEAYQDIFTSDGFTRENIGLDMFSSIKDELDELNKIEGINVDYSSFDEFVKILSKTNLTADEADEAFDNLASSIYNNINASGVLNSENAQMVSEMLRSIGVVNHYELALEAFELQEQYLADNKEELVKATNDKILAFLNEAGASETARQYLFTLIAQEKIFNNEDLNAQQKIEELEELATAYGQTALAAKIANMEKSAELGHYTIDYDKELKSLQAHLNDSIGQVKVDFNSIDTNASSAGKKAAEEYKDALKDELSDLDTVLGFITDTIQDQIDAWGDAKDEAVDSLTAQKEAAEKALEAEKELIQAQIDAIQERIDTKQDEIDAIQDARKEREANIDLMKKEYELQRLQNQNTHLVYKNGQMVYENDSKGVFDAREAVDEAKENLQIIAIEKEITDLENEIEDLEKVIDSIDKQIEASNDHFDKLIEQTEKYYDNLIKGMEEYKSRWEEISEIEEQAKINVMLEELGITTDDVLNMSGEAFEQFKKRYLDILTEMHKGESDMVTAINEVADGINTEKLSEGLDKTKENIDKLTKTDYSTVVNGVSNISNALNEIPSSDKYESLTNSFNLLAEAIQNVAIALGVTGDESVNGLIGALQTLGEFKFGEVEGGVIAQFTALKDAVDSVTTAINGGGSMANEGGGLATGANGGAAAPTESGGGSGLTSAIKEIGTATDETIGSGGESSKEGGKGESSGEGVIGKFSEFKSAVDDVIKTIGTGEEDEEGSISLISAINTNHEVVETTIPLVIDWFDKLLQKITECVNKAKELSTTVQSIDHNMMGTVPIHGKGTVGNAFAKGYNGLPRNEKNALRSEYGQPELTVYPDGTTELTTKPVMSDLPRDTVIFNEEQTRRIMNGKGTILGKSFVNGTTINPALTIQDINGKYLHDSFLNKLDDIILPINSINKNVESMFRMSSNIHNSNSMQPINLSIGDIQVHGVQDVNGLANAIANQLPNTLLQTMTKRK